MPTIDERKFELRQNYIYIDDKKLNNYDWLTVNCDVCNIEVKKQVKRFKEFYKEHKTCLCKKHQSEFTSLKKYGVKNCMQNEGILKKAHNTQRANNNGMLAFNTNKREVTMLKRYGVKNTWESKELVLKVMRTNTEKYGTPYPIRNKEISDKIKMTKKLKYGDENYNNMYKTIDTNIEKYGFECSLQNESVKNKSKETLIKRYGVEHVSEVPGVKEKIIETFIKNYGETHPSKNIDIKTKTMTTKLNNNSNNICKWFDIGNQKVQGKFELKVAEFLIENNINFIAHKMLKFISYIKEDLSRGLYSPDFYIPKYNVYLEPHAKYYWNKDFEHKMLEIKRTVDVLYFDESYDLTNILRYLYNKEL